MIDAALIIAIISYYTVMFITPGPNNAMLTISGLKVGFKRSFGVMVNYRYELAKIEKNHQEYVNEKKVNISNKVKKYV